MAANHVKKLQLTKELKKFWIKSFLTYKSQYHKTRDILHVMRILGHKNINNTLIYTHLVDFKDDEYVSKVATTVKEACQLVEAGFEYVCQIDGAQIFRKRK